MKNLHGIENEKVAEDVKFALQAKICMRHTQTGALPTIVDCGGDEGLLHTLREHFDFYLGLFSRAPRSIKEIMTN